MLTGEGTWGLNMDGDVPVDRPAADPGGLVGRIGRGDATAEEELVLTFERDVYRLLRGRMRDVEVAKELANDVLMAVVCALRAGRLLDASEQDERIAFLHQSLTRLASVDRQILLLTMIEGLKPAEIALRLGVSAEAVRTRKSRALHRLMQRAVHADA
jgi:DNA-directed RNA polymerase specialized sigma24 family protein